jgi:hypothetical protein
MTAGFRLQRFTNGDYGSEDYNRCGSVSKVDFHGQRMDGLRKMLHDIRELRTFANTQYLILRRNKTCFFKIRTNPLYIL